MRYKAILLLEGNQRLESGVYTTFEEAKEAMEDLVDTHSEKAKKTGILGGLRYSLVEYVPQVESKEGAN